MTHGTLICLGLKQCATLKKRGDRGRGGQLLANFSPVPQVFAKVKPAELTA